LFHLTEGQKKEFDKLKHGKALTIHFDEAQALHHGERVGRFFKNIGKKISHGFNKTFSKKNLKTAGRTVAKVAKPVVDKIVKTTIDEVVPGIISTAGAYVGIPPEVSEIASKPLTKLSKKGYTKLSNIVSDEIQGNSSGHSTNKAKVKKVMKTETPLKSNLTPIVPNNNMPPPTRPPPPLPRQTSTYTPAEIPSWVSGDTVVDDDGNNVDSGFYDDEDEESDWDGSGLKHRVAFKRFNQVYSKVGHILKPISKDVLQALKHKAISKINGLGIKNAKHQMKVRNAIKAYMKHHKLLGSALSGAALYQAGYGGSLKKVIRKRIKF
jgi:hypothetical protein